MQLTDAQAHLMAEWISGFEGGEAEDYEESIDVVRDDFECFAVSNWRKGHLIENGSLVDGTPVRAFERVQATPGQRRTNLYVADFGEFRAVYQI